MAKKFKVGVIGAGFIGPAHMEGIRRQGFEVTAVAASGLESSQEAADRLLIPKAYGEWRELVEDPELDVVHITSPNHLHFEQAKACLEAGKHVICEKPLAMTAKEALKMYKAAQQAGVVHMTAFNYRQVPAIIYAKAMIDAMPLVDKIKNSLEPIDALWFFLAIGSAFKLGAGLTGDD